MYNTVQTLGYWQLPGDENAQCMPRFLSMSALANIINKPTADADPFSL